MSFDFETVKLFSAKTDLRISFLSMDFNVDLKEKKQFSHIISVDVKEFKHNLNLGLKFVQTAHAENLEVHSWTFKDDNVQLGKSVVEQYYIALKLLKLDGIITEFPASAKGIIESLGRHLESPNNIFL